VARAASVDSRLRTDRHEVGPVFGRDIALAFHRRATGATRLTSHKKTQKDQLWEQTKPFAGRMV
jgi:hypothetical protein